MTEEASRLTKLKEKYRVPEAAPQVRAHQAFDANQSYGTDRSNLRRISKAPSVGQETTSIGALHKEMAGLQLDLVDLNEEHGKLNVDFRNVLGKDAIYGFGDALQLAFYTVTRQKKKKKEVKLDAIEKRGNALEQMVNRMAEVLEEQHQKAIQGKERAKGIQQENISHMKYLDQELIGHLKGSHYTGSDLTSAEKEVGKLEAEMHEIEQVLMEYQSDIQAAKATQDLDTIERLTEEVSQVLDIKYGILDGKLSADGVVSEIRRDMLDHAEGVQASKGAIAATRVNYQATGALIDAMNELEIKYKHAMSKMVPTFKVQAKIAGMGTQAIALKQTLVKAADISQRLMDFNVKLVTYLASESFDFVKNPIQDIERAKECEYRISSFMKQLNQQKKEFAEAMQMVSELPTTPHYAVPQ